MKILLKICGAITGIAGAIGVLWVAFTLSQKVINPPITKEEIKVIIQTEVKKATDPIATQNVGIMENQNSIMTTQSDILYNVGVVKDGLVLHMNRDSSATKQDITNLLEKYRNIVLDEVKKNSSSYLIQ